MGVKKNSEWKSCSFVGGDGDVCGGVGGRKIRRKICGWRGAVVGWSEPGLEPSGSQSSVARAGFLPCATSGNAAAVAAAVILARLLCFCKADRFLFVPLQARKGSTKPSPPSSLRPPAPPKDHARPPTSTPGFVKRCEPGWNPTALRVPFLCGDQELIHDFLC